jgi:hypothetical protein
MSLRESVRRFLGVPVFVKWITEIRTGVDLVRMGVDTVSGTVRETDDVVDEIKTDVEAIGVDVEAIRGDVQAIDDVKSDVEAIDGVAGKIWEAVERIETKVDEASASWGVETQRFRAYGLEIRNEAVNATKAVERIQAIEVAAILGVLRSLDERVGSVLDAVTMVAERVGKIERKVEEGDGDYSVIVGYVSSTATDVDRVIDELSRLGSIEADTKAIRILVEGETASRNAERRRIAIERARTLEEYARGKNATQNETSKAVDEGGGE